MKKCTKNLAVRTALKNKSLYLYNLADLLGVSEPTVTRLMRRELPEEEQKRIVCLIEEKGGMDNG